MATMRRTRTLTDGVVAAGLAVLVLTGCATEMAGTASVGSGTTTADPTGRPCGHGTADLGGAGPVGDPVIMVEGETNGWNIGTLWTRPVALATYDGGDTVRPVTPGDTGATIPAMERGRIDPCQLDAALDELADLTDADFGEPGVTDQGTTTVTIRPQGATGPQQIAVYALGIGPDSLRDLTEEQLVHRERLVAVLGELQGAVTDLAPWSPDRLRLTTLVGTPSGEGATYRWPGPKTLDESMQRRNPECLVLAGGEVAPVLSALGAGSSSAVWVDDYRSALLTTAVLVPGQPGCPE